MALNDVVNTAALESEDDVALADRMKAGRDACSPSSARSSSARTR